MSSFSLLSIALPDKDDIRECFCGNGQTKFGQLGVSYKTSLSVVRGLLGTSPPDPNLESALVCPLPKGRFGIDSTSIRH